MKTIIVLFLMLVCCGLTVRAQYKKNGTPDMRYSGNKQVSGKSKSSGSNSNTNSGVKYQRGYVKTDGTYVDPHYKTDNNKTNIDNFSTKDNYNYTNGKTGTRAKDYSNEAQKYGKGKTIYTGNKGGQYYNNEKSKRVYVPKR